MFFLWYRNLLLLASMFFCWVALAPVAQAQISNDDKETFIQQHFHFKDPKTGAELPTDSTALYGKLSKKMSTSNPDSTYFNEGYALAKYMDLRTKYGLNHFTDTFPDMRDMVNNAVGVSYGNVDPSTALSIALHYFVEAMQYDTPLYAVTLVWDTYSVLKTSWDFLNGILQLYYNAAIDETTRDYLQDKSSGATDEEAWADVSIKFNVTNIDASVGHNFSLKTFCETIYSQKSQMDTNLDVSIQNFTDKINSLLIGPIPKQPSVIFLFSPDYYAMTAPTQVTIDASQSVGQGGVALTPTATYQWTIDNAPAGTGPSITPMFWTPGTHTVSVTITDDSNYTQTGSKVFTVGSPPVNVASGSSALERAFSTQNSPPNPFVSHYRWDFGDNSPPSTGDSLTSVAHTFPNFGHYTVRLTETTTNGDTVFTDQPVSFDHTPTDIYGGTLPNSQIWDISGSPYRIHQTVTIPAGVRLTLGPGVVLQFDNSAGLDIYGEIVSKGQFTTSDRVYFTSYRDGSGPLVGGSDDGQAGDWRGLQFFAGSSSTLAASKIRYASTAVYGEPNVISGVSFDKDNTALSSSGSHSLTITANTFNGSQAYIVGQNSRDVTITNNTFTNCNPLLVHSGEFEH